MYLKHNHVVSPVTGVFLRHRFKQQSLRGVHPFSPRCMLDRHHLHHFSPQGVDYMENRSSNTRNPARKTDLPMSTDGLFPTVPRFVLCASKGGPAAWEASPMLIPSHHCLNDSPTASKPLSVVVLQCMTNTFLSPDRLPATGPLTYPHFARLGRGSRVTCRRWQKEVVYVGPCQRFILKDCMINCGSVCVLEVDITSIRRSIGWRRRRAC